MPSIVLGSVLVAVCIGMAVAAGAIYRWTRIGQAWVPPVAALRATAQLAGVSLILGAAMTGLYSSLLVLAVMFIVAAWTAARRCQASRGSAWLTLPLLAGSTATVPLMLVTGLVPRTGVALVPIVGILLGSTMTAVAVSARLSLNMLTLRAGEVDAALSLGFSARDAAWRMITTAIMMIGASIVQIEAVHVVFFVVK